MSAANRVSRWGLTVALASLLLPGTAGATVEAAASSAPDVQGTAGTVEAAVSRAPHVDAIVGSLAARFDNTLRGGGVVAEGASFAGREDGVVNTSANITIAGIPAGATVQRALLYWMILGGSDTTATINAVAVTGVQVAVAGSTCWNAPTTPTFRADVTPQVTGNGVYTIAGLPSSTNPAGVDTNGVALVVVYQDPTSGTVRRVMIRDGAISTSGTGEVVNDTFTGVAPPIASAGRFHLVVGDGQAVADGNLIFNVGLLGTNQFPGSDGSLWDVRSYNVNVPAGLANAAWSSQTGSDCLEYETAVLDFNVAVCGDGVIHSPEQCDQGNTTNGDGCSAQCNVEPGWQCSGQPSVCVRVADLGVTKTDGQTTAVPGLPITYTITASNAGPSAVTGAPVSDTFPAEILGATWTCVASAGSSCPPSGSGNINSPVDLLVGGTATFTATGTVNPSATGTLSNTATVAVPAGATDPVAANNSATDSDTLTPEGDLGITKTDGQTTYFPGQVLTYTIVASNPGPSTLIGAVVADVFPAELTGVSWTCTASAGSACGTASGTGNISVTVDLLSAGTATFTATATVAAGASGDIVNTANVTPPPGWSDPNLANNSATDTNALVAAEPVALAVDTSGNAVYEPNETVVVAPTWRNSGNAAVALTGTLTNHTGPAGPTYTIPDGSADYGTIAVGDPASCTATGDCYTVANTSATRPATHWDSTAVEAVNVGASKTWTLHIGDSFTDVPSSNGFYRFVETILHHQVTGGCTATTYCPANSTTREQMAVFVLVANDPGGPPPPACVAGAEQFTDVPASSGFCRWVEELANRGVVTGCAAGLYCPLNPATREQMAVFVLRTLDPTLNPPPCVAGSEQFADVPASSAFCRWIEELFNRGVVTGCGGGNYCPTAPVTREEMSVFLSVTFSLTLYGL